MVEDWGEACRPKEEPVVPKFNSPPCTMFYSAVFLLFKKMLARREGELWEKRVGYSFDEVSLSSCMILNCLFGKKKKKKGKNYPEPHFHCCFYPFCFRYLCSGSASAAWSAVLTLNYA